MTQWTKRLKTLLTDDQAKRSHIKLLWAGTSYSIRRFMAMISHFPESGESLYWSRKMPKHMINLYVIMLKFGGRVIKVEYKDDFTVVHTRRPIDWVGIENSIPFNEAYILEYAREAFYLPCLST